MLKQFSVSLFPFILFSKVMFLNGEDSDQLHWQHVMVTGHDIDTDADNCDGIT